MDVALPFFQFLATSSDCHDFPDLQDSGMHPIMSHRLLYVQIPQVVMNLIFLYSGRGFTPLLPILQFNWGWVRREVASED